MKTLKHLFTALLLLCSIAVSAAKFEVDGIYYNVTSSANKTVEVTCGTDKYTGSVLIPESVTYNGTTYSVTSIGNQAFRDCSSLTSVEIPSSVTSIKNETFAGCTGLTSITIPNGVTSIGGQAFRDCSSLTSVEIPNGVTSIGSQAFRDCSSLTSVEIPNGVTSIEYQAFSYCSSLTSVEIPNSVTSIGNSAFQYCKGLTSIEIPNGVTSIGTYVFSSCSKLKSVEIPNGVTSIGSNAFSYCSSLTSVEIPNSVTSIGDNAFSYCSGLTSVEIPNSVTSIGISAFSYCSSLTSVEIPNSVTSIGQYAFYECSGLTSVEIPNSVTSIGFSAFYSCSSLKEVHISDIGAWCGIRFADSNYANPLYIAKNLYLNGELVTELVIPEGVTEVKASAFVGYDKLLNVTIPSSVTKIGSSAFSSGANAVFDIAAEELSTIGSGAFHPNAVIVVPDAVVDAYKAAWSGYAAQITGKSEAFVSVDVKAMDATSGIMERVGIDKMSSIAKLTVKGSINSYDVIQFRDKMPLLRELDLSEATVVASDKAFYNGNCTKDNDLGGYAFHNMSKLNYVKLPKDLIAVGARSFYGCSSLREMVVPETVQSIGESAFYNCTSLKNVELPKEMVSIGDYAFYQCSSLGEIIIPIGVKSTGRYVFEGCSSLERVTLPNGLESIGYAAFSYCRALNEIKIPPTVQFLGINAFYKCSSLEEIRIPSSVTSIGSSAFADCSNLAKVYTYTVEPTAIQENTFSTFQTATLYVPSFSFSNYYWDDGWKRFLNLAEFNEPYEYFYVNNDYVLNDDTGYIEGVEGENPDADINAGGGIIIEGEQGDDEIPNQSLGDVNVGCDGEGTSGSIIGDNNLHIDDLHIKINVKGGRWYFFAFPFDIKIDKISMQNGSDYVFRYYDGEERATKGNGGWKDVNESHLKAARGYIFQCSANDVLVLSIEDVKFKKEDKYNELVAHVSENLKDASWNFVGNPYLSYYDLADMDYTAPVTVWDGSKYVAIRPGDDDYHFAPYEAFFVQKPEGQESIAYDGEEQMTQNQSEKKMEKQAAARRARSVDTERLLVNIVLGDGATSDRTRIVFNERQSLAYETSCDATKFSTAGVVQLYTIGSDNVHYAINERPADNGVVMLGYTAPTAGFYTIEAQRMDAEVFVKDYKTGTLHNLKDGAYSFSTDAGTFNDRFEILLKGTAPGTTGIDEVEGENGKVKTENGEVKGDIYDLQGRKMQNTGKGIYIINGEKVVK